MTLTKSFGFLLAEVENFSYCRLNKLQFKIKKFFAEI